MSIEIQNNKQHAALLSSLNQFLEAATGAIETLNQSLYYNDEEVAGILGIELNVLISKISNRAPLPPSINLPGIRKRLWLKETVHLWMKYYEGEWEEHMI